MRTWKPALLLVSLSLLFSGYVRAQEAGMNQPALLKVTILDENGSLVHRARIYIYSNDKKMFSGTRDAYGTTDFQLPAGDYRIYAGLTMKSNGIVDHYASPEASVHVDTDEPASVILALQKAEDNEMVLSDT